MVNKAKQDVTSLIQKEIFFANLTDSMDVNLSKL